MSVNETQAPSNPVIPGRERKLANPESRNRVPNVRLDSGFAA